MLSLAPVAVFADLPVAIRHGLEMSAQWLDLHDGTVVFAEGERADAVYGVVDGDGSVRIGSAGYRGKSLMVEVFRVGDLFGEIAVIDGGLRSAEAVVSGRVHLARVGAGPFLAAIREAPALGLALYRMMAGRLRRTYTLLQDATFEPLEARLARQLLYLAALSGQPAADGVRLGERFRQQDLADLLGTTPRSIITILNAWRTAGVLTFNAMTGQIVIAPDRLRAILAHTGTTARTE
jgi:CRP/FNR family transcriptional regulator, cyclic AMP receptor protein